MYEYKVVPAPQRAVKVKGLKTTADRFAHALAERINAEAAGGWQFLRTETLACEERSGLGRVRNSTQTVMVFARTLGQSRPDAGAALAAVQSEAASQDLSRPQDPAPQPEAPEMWSAPSQHDWHEPAAEQPVQDTNRDDRPARRVERDEPQLGTLRRHEPLFRSGARLHEERPGRAEPVVRPPRADQASDEG